MQNNKKGKRPKPQGFNTQALDVHKYTNIENFGKTNNIAKKYSGHMIN